jgi:hypothetical protein
LAYPKQWKALLPQLQSASGWTLAGLTGTPLPDHPKVNTEGKYGRARCMYVRGPAPPLM